MRYKAVRELDGTYSVRASVMGMNYSEVIMLGLRPCNVERVLNKLNSDDYRKQLKESRSGQENSSIASR